MALSTSALRRHQEHRPPPDAADMESVRQSLFSPGNLTQPYHSVNVDVNKRIRFLD